MQLRICMSGMSQDPTLQRAAQAAVLCRSLCTHTILHCLIIFVSHAPLLLSSQAF